MPIKFLFSVAWINNKTRRPFMVRNLVRLILPTSCKIYSKKQHLGTIKFRTRKSVLRTDQLKTDFNFGQSFWAIQTYKDYAPCAWLVYSIIVNETLSTINNSFANIKLRIFKRFSTSRTIFFDFRHKCFFRFSLLDVKSAYFIFAF